MSFIYENLCYIFMKKLSTSLWGTYFQQLQDIGIEGVLRFGLQGHVLHASPCQGPVPPAGALRFALQESIEVGGVYLHVVSAGIQWVFALEHQRTLHGGVCSCVYADRNKDSVMEEGERAFQTFYHVFGWMPVLLRERREGCLRRQQMAAAKLQQTQALGWGHAPELEHQLLACIRAGDRNGARRLLNEMLAAIYMSGPQLLLLRARIIELMSVLTRAAIEDNPLLESLILQNHHWAERLIHADTFEFLSEVLMQALDQFIDAVHLHGINRTNVYVHKALTFIASCYQEPLRLEQVAAEAGISKYRLAHLFREHTGKTVVETIRHVRLERATNLLSETSMTCAEVAYAVGFTDQSYFIYHFKRYMGCTPIVFRRDKARTT